MAPTTPTTTTGAPEGFIFQRDTMGRVRVPAARREALLDEFERGGASGQAFAAMVGVRYSTFATWMQDRRRAARVRVHPAPGRTPAPALATTRPAGTMRWLEALVAEPPVAAATPTAKGAAGTLHLILPGGASLEICDAGQTALAAALLRALQKDG